MTRCNLSRPEVPEKDRIRVDAAPMEGITDFSWRMAHSRHFSGTDRYYSPFIAANRTLSMKTREKKDVAPENNSGVLLVPQILTNQADVFVWAAKEMALRGWKTVNLNLGCPSATVFTHGKGAGFLSDPERLDAFFEEVFSLLPADIRVSVKTRIGIEDSEEAGALIAVFNRYPIDELIVHPRLRKDFYIGEVDLDTWQRFTEEYHGDLTYNGDIRTGADAESLKKRFPGLSRIMTGRGLIADPSLARRISGGPALTKEELFAFHDDVFERRMEDLRDFRNVEGKMKEMWYYMGVLFEGAEGYLKKIRKAGSSLEYRAAVRRLFSQCDLKDNIEP